jgi:cytochrome c peroxidase
MAMVRPACRFVAATVWFAVLLAGSLAPAFAQTFSGLMSGSWWDASRAGEGQFITFESAGGRNVAYLAYFTYTADGQATWHVGSIDYQPGAASVSIPLVTGAGPRFGAAYSPAGLTTTNAGTATLEFVSCAQMRLRHSAIAGTTLNLTRLVGPLVGADCAAAAPPTATATALTSAMSGHWWNATRGGEGQFITFESTGGRNVAYLAYFTYTADGRASWLVGNADYAAGATSVTIPLITGSGPRFGTAFRAADLTTAPAGSVRLDFVSCSVLRLTYTGTQTFTVDLARLVGPLTGYACSDSSPPSATDTALRFLLAQSGVSGNARAGRNLPSIDDPLPQLGKLLFFSKALSAGNDVACATCHHPTLGGGDGMSISIGAGAESANLVGPGRRLPTSRILVGRNANTFFNVGLYDSGHFWDSRVESLGKLANRNGAGSGIRTPDTPLNVADPAAGPTLPAAQARFPVVGAAEMLGTGFPGITGDSAIRAHIASRLGDYGSGRGQLAPSQWLQKFRNGLGSAAGTAEDLITFANITQAIAEYQRSATFVDSPFARYAAGNNSAISEQAKRGALFFFRPLGDGGAQCAQCHVGNFFTNEQHHAIGFPQVGPGMGDGAGATDDFGRARQSGDALERYRFRTPSLLNVEVTGPYGHSGAYASLEKAVEHYFTPDATLNGFLARREWCSLPPFSSTSNCADSAADVTRNSQAALAKLRSDQASFPALSMPAINLARVPQSAVADIAAFLRTLTDPCVKDRACVGKWIPSAGEAPDAHQLNAVNAAGQPL